MCNSLVIVCPDALTKTCVFLLARSHHVTSQEAVANQLIETESATRQTMTWRRRTGAPLPLFRKTTKQKTRNG